jgi:hypothetical protein
VKQLEIMRSNSVLGIFIFTKLNKSIVFESKELVRRREKQMLEEDVVCDTRDDILANVNFKFSQKDEEYD